MSTRRRSETSPTRRWRTAHSLRTRTSASSLSTLSTWAGIHADRFDVAAEQAARVLELGRARGRPLLIVGGAHVLCAVRIRQGRVWEAEAHGWDAVRFIETIPVVRGQAVLQLVEALLARGALEEVGRLLVDQGLEGDGLLQSYANLAFLVRAKWHRAAGRPRDALADLGSARSA